MWQCLDMMGVNEGNMSPLKPGSWRGVTNGRRRSDQGGDALLTRSGNEKLVCVTDVF